VSDFSYTTHKITRVTGVPTSKDQMRCLIYDTQDGPKVNCERAGSGVRSVLVWKWSFAYAWVSEAKNSLKTSLPPS
jgi:hypothetical protein